MIGAYKNLARVERDFRSLKTDDLDLRPIHHRLEDRVRAHVLICMLAAYLTWHLAAAHSSIAATTAASLASRNASGSGNPGIEHTSTPRGADKSRP